MKEKLNVNYKKKNYHMAHVTTLDKIYYYHDPFI